MQSGAMHNEEYVAVGSSRDTCSLPKKGDSTPMENLSYAQSLASEGGATE
jgi:hypothetical protein